MRKLVVYEQVSLDGFFTDADGDMSWAHQDTSDPEWQEFVAGNASGGGALLFGRVTYEMMASFWPTPMAAKQMPVVAERMNAMPKVVFSRSLDRASWKGTTLVKDELPGAVRAMKKETGPVITVLGSGSIVSQLAQADLVDEYMIVVAPIVLGQGRTLFEDVDRKLDLVHTSTRTFGNGKVLLRYAPAKRSR